MLRALCQELLEGKADPRALAVPLATPDAPTAILADLLRSEKLACGLAERRVAYRELIQAAYREILDRPAVADELAGHEAFFQENGALIGVPHLVTELFSNESFRERVALRMPRVHATHREIIDTTYRAILARPADPHGLAAFEQSLLEKGAMEGVLHLVKSLLAGHEFHQLLSSHALHALGPQGGRLINGAKVAHIISLGTHCLTSFYLQKFQLRRYSLPFDWLFTSPKTVLHCLENDFAEFLDPRHYASVPKGSREKPEPGANHLFYRQQHGVHDMFAHRDPTDEKDRIYFSRAVGRFRQVMALPDAKLFVMVVRPIHNAVDIFGLLSAQLRAMTQNSAFICVQLRPPTKQPGCHIMRQLHEDGQHALYEFKPSSVELGVGFEEAVDDLMILRLVRQYDIDLMPAPASPDEGDPEAQSRSESSVAE